MPPIVIAHRGASGHRPEHTLAAYELGRAPGRGLHRARPRVDRATGTSSRATRTRSRRRRTSRERPEFADRRATKTIDGVDLDGWFAEDFTLAELKTLRARERIPELRPGNAEHDGRYEIPTFQEIIDLAARGSRVGIYPETKHPSYHRSIGLPLEPGLVDALRRNGLDHPGAQVFVQSFEAENLQMLRAELGVPLVQLLGPRGDGGPEGLRAIAEYADAVGPNKVHIVPRDAAGGSLPPTRFVADAHAAGLLVHPYTFRRENSFLPAELRRGEDPAAPGDLAAELRQFLALGVDGVFADYPDVAVSAR